jgi:hypothetical protein
MSGPANAKEKARRVSGLGKYRMGPERFFHTSSIDRVLTVFTSNEHAPARADGIPFFRES